MQAFTEYPGPGRDDYVNVLALNTAFLDAFYELKGPQRGRLAAAPFLLFTLRESDLDWWATALEDRPQSDMLVVPESISASQRSLQAASISFLWQLVRRDSHAARLVSGAPVAWCEMLSKLPLVTLLERVAARSDLLESRLGDANDTCSQLLNNAASSRRKVRRSSQVVALQSLLTSARNEQYHRQPAAACRLPAARFRVADGGAEASD